MAHDITTHAREYPLKMVISLLSPESSTGILIPLKNSIDSSSYMARLLGRNSAWRESIWLWKSLLAHPSLPLIMDTRSWFRNSMGLSQMRLTRDSIRVILGT